ncbi:LysR family transcriptional regulator [Saccharothrix sp. NRRL B-16348]|uniref:LysR family transcriptional regulator n=1 Tax=Saccharothrix sp. NRRL B-16348 TaxID=1415542 RepID=UPI0006ADBAB3|nr:LysR substrate-binding domain-containing protein [Saccharothrix sp. NRRL B-16348]
MSIDLRLMRYVVAVADEGGFQRAADRLHVAQPALSRQVGDLERALGVTLFTRRPTGLTEAGREFVASARRILDDADRLLERSRAAGRGEFGSVRLGFVTSAAYGAVPRLVDAVGERHPNLTVDQVEGWSVELVEGLLAKRFDLVLSRSVPERPEFDRIPFQREDLIVVVGAAHPLAGRAAVTPADLVGSRLLLSRRHMPGYRAALLSALGHVPEVEDTRLPGWRRFDELAAGENYQLVPRTLGDHLPADAVMIPFADRVPAPDLELVWRREPSPSAGLVIACAAGQAPDGGR